MSSSKDEEAKNWVEKMTENFLKEIPDEVCLPSDEPDLLEGTSREVAFLTEDGSLFMRISGQKDYVMGQGWDSIAPDDPSYEELCAKYGLKRPGDGKCIISRFLDGEWVEVDVVERKSPMTDSSQNSDSPAPFGPEDNSIIAKLLRGEIELEDDGKPPKEHPTLFESASIRESDGLIVRVVNGTHKYKYYADDPRYPQYIEKLKETFPDLAPGKICFRYYYKGGRVEIKTKEYGKLNDS